MFLDCANEPNTLKLHLKKPIILLLSSKDFCTFGRNGSGLTVAREIFNLSLV